MGTRSEVAAGGCVYEVTDDLTVEHRLAFRGHVTDAATTLPVAVPMRVRPGHPRAFAVVRPGAEFLLAVGADPPLQVRVRVSAVGYQTQTLTLAVPAPGAVTAVSVALNPLPA